PKFEVVKAYYEPADGSKPGADVTAKVKQLVDSGELSIGATNSNFGDPTPNIVKRLRIEYTLDGKPMTKTAGENQNVELGPPENEVTPSSFDIRAGSGGYQLIPWERGEYRVDLTDRRSTGVRVDKGASVTPVVGSWTVKFAKDWGAPS